MVTQDYFQNRLDWTRIVGRYDKPVLSQTHAMAVGLLRSDGTPEPIRSNVDIESMGTVHEFEFEKIKPQLIDWKKKDIIDEETKLYAWIDGIKYSAPYTWSQWLNMDLPDLVLLREHGKKYAGIIKTMDPNDPEILDLITAKVKSGVTTDETDSNDKIISFLLFLWSVQVIKIRQKMLGQHPTNSEVERVISDIGQLRAQDKTDYEIRDILNIELRTYQRYVKRINEEDKEIWCSITVNEMESELLRLKETFEQAFHRAKENSENEKDDGAILEALDAKDNARVNIVKLLVEAPEPVQKIKGGLVYPITRRIFLY